MYSIGGWDTTFDYTNNVDRIKIGADGTGAAWEEYPQKLNEGRADMACEEVQVNIEV